MRSKIDAHLREIRFVQSLLPITSIVLETGTFDPHALKNPEVLQKKWLYQRGITYGFANTKAYVLTRDTYTCQHCKGTSKDKRLEVHHLIFRQHNGSDEEGNLLTLCKTCHDSQLWPFLCLLQRGGAEGWEGLTEKYYSPSSVLRRVTDTLGLSSWPLVRNVQKH